MNGFYRVLIALTAVLPLFLVSLISCEVSILSWLKGWSCLQYRSECLLYCFFSGIVLLCVLIIFFLANWAKKNILAMRDEGASIPLTIVGTKRLGMNCLSDYLPYVLPFFFSGAIEINLVSWLLGIGCLFILAYLSSTVSYSPLLNLVGIHFYECQTNINRTIIVLSVKDVRSDEKKSQNLVQISEDCYLLKQEVK